MGYAPISLNELPTVEDRLSFLYLEHCVVHREENSLTMRDELGEVRVPAAALSCLLLGPGTTVSHQAMVLAAECGISCVWIGQNGVRYYAHGRSLAQSTALLVEQAKLVSNERKRLAVARAMYQMRFSDEDVSALTMRQLRGREGARMRQIYRDNARRTGVRWNGRQYDPKDFTASDAVNQALSTANFALYGVVHAVIVALGCSPSLGFVHCGRERAFVFDMADLYKAEISIPTAFDTAAEDTVDISAAVRKAVRDRIFDSKLVPRLVHDIKTLLGVDAQPDDEGATVLQLWDFRSGAVAAGTNYGGVPR